MSVPELLNHVLHTDLPRSVQIFAPELVLCVTIIALLLVRMLKWHHKFPTSWVALFGTLAAFVGVFAQFMYMKTGGELPQMRELFEFWGLTQAGVGTAGEYFTGLLVHDPFAVFFRLGLVLFLVLVQALTILTGIPDQEDGQDFYTLMIGATIGMMLACGSNNLLMLFMAVEMMSVPSYAMVGFLKGRRQSSEAALKYVVYGAGAAGVMLYGISLLAAAKKVKKLPYRDIPMEAERPLFKFTTPLTQFDLPFYGVKTNRYKYVHWSFGDVELYDMKKDPYELENLASDPDMVGVVSQLEAKAQQLQDCKGKTCR